MKIALGVHLAEAVLPQVYLNHIGAIAKWAQSYDLTLIGTYRAKVAAARNSIVDRAIKDKYSHVFFLDSDHIVSDDLLDLLAESADAAMVSGLICKRIFPFECVAFKCLPNGDLTQIVVSERKKVIPVDACAMGCTLVNLKHIKKLKKPYFFDARYRSDINLCLAFRAIDCKIMIDTRAEIGHLAEPVIVRPNMAEALRVKCIEEMKLDENTSSN